MTTHTTSIDTCPTSSERLAAMIAHGGTVFAWTLAPLIVYLVKRGDSKYAEFHALQALLWSLLGTAVSLATCGVAIPIFMVWHIIAAVRVYEGRRDEEYPLVGSIARGLVYDR